MSEGGIESFGASEQNEGVDAAALEQLREQMSAARAQMKKDQAQEKKQKGQEDSLFEIIFTLIKKLGHKDPRIQLIVACLAKNFTAHTILVIMSLEFSSVSKIAEIAYLKEDTELSKAQSKNFIVRELGKDGLQTYLRYNLDLWLKELNKSIFARSEKSYKAISNKDHGSQGIDVLKDILVFIAEDHLKRNNGQFTKSHLVHFINLFVDNLSERLNKHILSLKPITSTKPETESIPEAEESSNFVYQHKDIKSEL